jgi:hypothetical protein
MGCIEFDLFGADSGRPDPDDRPVDICRGRALDRPGQVTVSRDQKRQETSTDQNEIPENRHEAPHIHLRSKLASQREKAANVPRRVHTLRYSMRLCNQGGRDKTAITTAWRFGMSIEIDAAANRAWETYRMINPTASENLRQAVQRFIAGLAQTNDLSAEALAVEGLKYLKGTEDEQRPSAP